MVSYVGLRWRTWPTTRPLQTRPPTRPAVDVQRRRRGRLTTHERVLEVLPTGPRRPRSPTLNAQQALPASPRRHSASGSSMSVSTPPADVAWTMMRTRSATACAAAAPPETSNASIAPKPSMRRGGAVVERVGGEAGVVDGGDRRVDGGLVGERRRRTAGRARAGPATCAGPPSARKASSAPGSHAARAAGVAQRRRALAASRVVAIPSIRSEWPLMNFVAGCCA